MVIRRASPQTDKGPAYIRTRPAGDQCLRDRHSRCGGLRGDAPGAVWRRPAAPSGAPATAQWPEPPAPSAMGRNEGQPYWMLGWAAREIAACRGCNRTTCSIKRNVKWLMVNGTVSARAQCSIHHAGISHMRKALSAQTHSKTFYTKSSQNKQHPELQRALTQSNQASCS